MIVYVESNFVLELALGQEQAQDAEAILKLAEEKHIELAFPGFALSEPFATLDHQHKEQSRLSKSLADMLRQLQRSAPHRATVSTMSGMPGALAGIARLESDRLQETIRRLLDAGTCLRLDGATFHEAMAAQPRFDLSPQDSVIYAVMIADLRTRPPGEPKCFISRNWKDFRNPDILNELRTYQCVYAESFAEGLAIITAQP